MHFVRGTFANTTFFHNSPLQSDPSVPGGHKHLLFASHDPPFLHAGLQDTTTPSEKKVINIFNLSTQFIF